MVSGSAGVMVRVRAREVGRVMIVVRMALLRMVALTMRMPMSENQAGHPNELSCGGRGIG